MRSILRLLGILICVAYSIGATESHPRGAISYSEFLAEVRSGDIARVTILGQRATISMTNGATATTVLPADYRDALSMLQDKRVDVEIKDSSPSVFDAAPFLVLGFVWIVWMIKVKSR